ncbi:hypothetical protein I3U40_18190 [Mycobacteroides abscessus subsp. abscessus]|uniref:hypothetical protein n=1 Tax=Mycobacteroides abscessus TaxID=36809 RepID=UPI0009D2312D|nr:hypothetical protein [Mycobacteroides abscessus]QSM92987.1 hypothetical protein I3U31_18180 [Mycobacteroides abscessus subsp. abscessus]QSM98025.1 hypothetical protein I3U40_18190 [Mycobacteroides abscessus subsp. abscessus]SLI40967.1 F0F1 ATP synthase subunit delta [Mycobacteroides abscessus subsp. abscessus]
MTPEQLQQAAAAYNHRCDQFTANSHLLPEPVREREFQYLASEKQRLTAISQSQQTPTQTGTVVEVMGSRAKLGLWGAGALIVGVILYGLGAGIGALIGFIGIVLLLWSWIAKPPKPTQPAAANNAGVQLQQAEQVFAERAAAAEQHQRQLQEAEQRARAEVERKRQEALDYAAQMAQASRHADDEWS